MKLTEDQLRQAREWFAECQWADCEPEDFEGMPAARIERGIARNYEGGLEAFALACTPANPA